MTGIIDILKAPDMPRNEANMMEKNEIQQIDDEMFYIDDLIKDATGTCKVKVNTRWIIEIPCSAIKKYAVERKVQLEDTKSNLESKI